MNLAEKRCDSIKIFEGKIINVRLDTVILPNGKKAKRETVEHPGATAIIPVENDGNVVLIKQYRNPINKVILEIPAGKLEKGEDPQDCAARELQEETGLRSGKLTHLATFYTTPGIRDEILYLYAAFDLEKSLTNPDKDEFLEVVSIPLSELFLMVEKKEIVDAKTLIGIMMVKNILKDKSW